VCHRDTGSGFARHPLVLVVGLRAKGPFAFHHPIPKRLPRQRSLYITATMLDNAGSIRERAGDDFADGPCQH
jgi:hypothetical protein